MKKSYRSILLVLTLFFAFFISSAALWAYVWLNKPLEFDQESNYQIRKGQSLYSVASELNEKSIVYWPQLWVAYARFKSLSNIRAGEYKLEDGVSPVGLLQLFNSAEVVNYSITFVEGKNFSELLNELQKHTALVKKLDGVKASNALPFLQLELAHPEGWFFPDTYRYTASDTDVAVLQRAFKKMQVVLQDEWQSRANDLPYKTPYEALIMASIVEKETGAAFEREKIAGVFVRRLQKNMRLQTDPTVIYGMGDNYKGNIRRRDLKTATPYNTYVIKGLPPTPIAMPGREAIYAALHPASGTSLYFVAKGDGTHQFSATVEEHNEAVRKYQLKRRADYRSSPKENTE